MWSFTVDEDNFVFVHSPSGIPENTRLAFETLIIALGVNVDSAGDYFRVWVDMWDEHMSDYSVSTSSATASRVDRDNVKLVDMYGQFEDCVMSVEEFEEAFKGFMKFLDQRGS